MKKRTMIFILALCMVLASLPFPVSAASVITKLEIEDAIAPINGEAPVTSIKETD